MGNKHRAPGVLQAREKQGRAGRSCTVLAQGTLPPGCWATGPLTAALGGDSAGCLTTPPPASLSLWVQRACPVLHWSGESQRGLLSPPAGGGSCGTGQCPGSPGRGLSPGPSCVCGSCMLRPPSFQEATCLPQGPGKGRQGPRRPGYSGRRVGKHRGGRGVSRPVAEWRGQGIRPKEHLNCIIILLFFPLL